MHSNIFSTSMFIPTLAIAYEKKTDGIMKTVKQEKYVEDIDNISSESLITKLEDIMKNKQIISDVLKETIPTIKEEIDEKIRRYIKN